MYEYTHGANIYDKNGQAGGLIDFSANINPLGMPPGALEAAQAALTSAVRYPDSESRALTLALARFENVDASSILCGNGASDILFRLMLAVKPRKILVTAPSFADYERAGKAAGAKVIHHYLSPENSFDIGDSILSSARKHAPDIAFICNPNNPTGCLTGINIIHELAKICKYLLVDECFLDFVYDSHTYTAKALLDEHKNIIILKAFTKIFAMPGLRLGYAITAEETVDSLRFHGPDWPVSNVAQAAGLAALTNANAYISAAVTYIQKEREAMTAALSKLGLTVYPSHANFLFFHCPRNIDLRAEMLKHGLLIRDYSNFPGLTRGYYRTAVLTKEYNKKLIDTIRSVSEAW